jgi:hypothetical protein
MATAAQRAQLQALVKPVPNFSGEEVGGVSNFLGRLAAGFGSNPQERENILSNWGLNRGVRDPIGFDIGDIADEVGPSFPLIAGAIGGAAGGLLGLPIGAPITTGMAAAAPAAAIGDALRQGLGNVLGSEGGFNSRSLATEAATAGTGEGFGGAAFRVANRFLRPFRGQTGTTKALEDAVRTLDRELGTNLGGTMPASAKSERVGTFFSVPESESRLAASPDEIVTGTGRTTTQGDLIRSQVTQPREQEASRAFEAIRTQGGVPQGGSKSDLGDVLLEATTQTLEEREVAVGLLFDDVRAAIPSPNTLPVVLDETPRALARISKRLQVTDLEDFNITAGSAQELQKLFEDVSNIRNFTQLDAFRKRIGKVLKSEGMLEQFRQVGMDREFRDLYGAIARDAKASIEQGQFAREFGGQVSGVVDDAASRNVSAMERGSLSQRELPSAPPGGPLGTRQAREVPSGQQQTSTDLLDNLSQRVDDALGKIERANASFSDLMRIEETAAARFLKTPETASQLVRSLTGEKNAPGVVLAVKRKVGAEGTELTPATEVGTEAWREFQAQVLDRLWNDSVRLVRGQSRISGSDLLKGIERLGGDEVLDIILPPNTSRQLRSLAIFLKESNVGERSFSSIPSEMGQATPFDVIPMARNFIQRKFDGFISPRLRSPGGKDFLTKGIFQQPKQQGFLRALSTLGGQGLTQGTFPNANNR